MPRCAHHSLNQRHDARPLEDLDLSRIFLENLRKSESFNCALSVIVDEWPNGDMCGMAIFALLDCKKAGVCGVRRAQSQVNVEKGARRPRWRLHGHCK